MNITKSSYSDMLKARDYAAELRSEGNPRKCQDVQVFRYRIRCNNYPVEDRRSWREWTGYAVRFSTTPEEDARIGGTGKFHDRSLVLFCEGENGIPMDKLWPHGRIIADFAGEEIVPMWLGWRSPFEDSDKYDPDRITAGFKRARVRKQGEFAASPDGPITYYHVVLDPIS